MMCHAGRCLAKVAFLGLALVFMAAWMDDDPSPARVIVHVNRSQVISGTVESEDLDKLVLVTQRGERHTILKGRAQQIVRLVDPLPNQSGLVIMRDGEVREGVIIEDAFEHVLIEIEGIRARLKREQVSHVILQPTFEVRYAQYKAAIRPGMHEAHFKLCQWLNDERRYELARTELEALLDQVEMAEARQLLTVVNAQIALREGRGEEIHQDPDAPESDAHQEPTTRSGPVRDEDILPQQLISEEDVNVIRVYELDFEHPVRVSIEPDVVRDLIEKYGTNELIPASQTGRSALFRVAADRPLEIVRLMFELRARDMYPRVKVNSEPYALNLFRQRVHDTWLMNTCATRACHGGPHAGPFFLHRRNYKDERVRYTNLLILERLKLDTEWPLINYEDPERSLIIQYALPRDQARKPHPRVTRWSPAFSPTSPRMKQDAMEWIRAMMVPRPDYPVEYEPPLLGTPMPERDLNAPDQADPDRPPR